jgi:methionine--tRNA ligase beta chain
MSLTMKDFQKLDIRIGRIVKAERIPQFKKILKVHVDMGGQIIETVAGGAESYLPENLVDKLVVVLVNLEPKVIAGIASKGMLLAADVSGKPVWLTVPQEVPLGTRVR